MSETDTEVLVWHAYEHDHIEREADWYWAVGIVAVSIALISLIFGNFLFAIIVIIGLFILAKLAQHKPELTRFEISKKGVRIGEQLHAYNEVSAFWVIEGEDGEEVEPRLLLATNKIMTHFLVIPIRHFEPSVVRAYLKKHLKETPLREPFGHKVLEFLGM